MRVFEGQTASGTILAFVFTHSGFRRSMCCYYRVDLVVTFDVFWRRASDFAKFVLADLKEIFLVLM